MRDASHATLECSRQPVAATQDDQILSYVNVPMMWMLSPVDLLSEPARRVRDPAYNRGTTARVRKSGLHLAVCELQFLDRSSRKRKMLRIRNSRSSSRLLELFEPSRLALGMHVGNSDRQSSGFTSEASISTETAWRIRSTCRTKRNLPFFCTRMPWIPRRGPAMTSTRRPMWRYG